MKKTISLFAVFLSVMFVFSSCSKYEDGPLLSLKSKEKRVAGTYTVAEVYYNGQSETVTDEVVYAFNEDGTGSQTSSGNLIIGSVSVVLDMEWKLSDDETELMWHTKLNIDESYPEEWDSYRILKLTDDEIWVEYNNILNDLVEKHFMEQ